MMIKLTCNDLHDLQQLPQNHHLSLLWQKDIPAMAIFHQNQLPQNEPSFSIIAKKIWMAIFHLKVLIL